MDALLAKRVALLEERLAAIRAMKSSGTPTEEVGSSAMENINAVVDWKNLPLTDAIYAHLKSCGEREQRVEDIWTALSNAGCEVSSNDPISSVRSALYNLTQKNSDVVNVGYGLWNLRSNYKPKRLEELLKKPLRPSGRGNLSRDDHIARTKAGIKRVMASGKRFGARSKVTEETFTKYLALLGEGRTQAEAVKEIDICTATVHRFYRLHDAKSWRPGDPWPPPLKASKDSSPAQDEGNVLPFAKGA